VKPASAKAKGRRLQQYVRDRIREAFGLHEDDVQSRSTSAGGEDVILSEKARGVFPFSIECKNVQRLNLWKSWGQTVENAGEHDPLLVVSRNHAEVLAVVRLQDLIELCQAVR